ncbi:MAG: hypothetical protein IH945_06260 [Armatimonadetes bacterium]|nr:hypothetical protein [Armatimonadota bacterium]
MQYVFWIQTPDGTKEKIHEQEANVLFERREIITIDGIRHAIQMLERRMEAGKDIITDVICVRMEVATTGTEEEETEPKEPTAPTEPTVADEGQIKPYD